MTDYYKAFERFSLPNGMDVWLAHLPHVPLQGLRACIHGGTRHNPIPGLAHFTEHVVASSGKCFDLIDKMDNEGGEFMGGSTSAFLTEYQFTSPLKSFSNWTKTLFDYVMASKLEDNYENERRVIGSEFTREFASEKDVKRLQLFYNSAYPECWYKGRFSSLGTPSDLEEITPEKVREFYNRFYRPDQIALLCAGPMAIDEVLNALSSSKWGTMQKKGSHEPVPAAYEARPSYLKSFARLGDNDDVKLQSCVCLSKKYSPLEVCLANNVLSTIFHNLLRKQNSLIYSLSTNWGNYLEFYDLSLSFRGLSPLAFSKTLSTVS